LALTGSAAQAQIPIDILAEALGYLPIEYGQTVMSELDATDTDAGPGTYTESLVFRGTMGDAIVVTVNSDAFTPQVQIADENSNFFAGAEGQGSEAQLRYTLTRSGNHFLTIRAHEGGPVGAYSVTLATE
jgi:hypothetical protein